MLTVRQSEALAVEGIRLAAQQRRPWWFPFRLYAYAFGRGYVLGRAQV